jgi:chromosome transmission fidelity protein 18
VYIYGNNSKFLDRLFTNLLQVSYVDPTIDRCALAHEWLSSTDTFGTNKTMPAAAAAIHLLCRVETKLGLTFSNRRMMDAHYQREANVNLTEKFVEGLTPNARGAGHGTVALETVPYSLWMLSAGHGSFSLNRAVSSLGILSKSEREAFNSHVSTLRSLGLTYVANEERSLKLHNEKSGPVTMRLEPQIDRLIHFEELSVPPENRRKQVPSVVSNEEQRLLSTLSFYHFRSLSFCPSLKSSLPTVL